MNEKRKKHLRRVIITLAVIALSLLIVSIIYIFSFYGFIPISEFRLSDWTKRPSWRYGDSDIPTATFLKEEDLIEYAYKEFHMDDSFELCEMRGYYSPDGSMTGIWDVTFGKMIGSKPLKYIMSIDVELGVGMDWVKEYTSMANWCDFDYEKNYKPFSDQLSVVLEYLAFSGIEMDDVVDIYFKHMFNYSYVEVELIDADDVVLNINIASHEIEKCK